MANNSPVNPFRKNPQKSTLVQVSLMPDQLEIVEALGGHLDIKTRPGVMMEALAVLYEKYRRQIAAGGAAGGDDDTAGAE